MALIEKIWYNNREEYASIPRRPLARFDRQLRQYTIRISDPKIVIVCPLWLLFVILLTLFLLIFRILSAKKKSRSEK